MGKIRTCSSIIFAASSFAKKFQYPKLSYPNTCFDMALIAARSKGAGGEYGMAKNPNASNLSP